MQQFQNPLKCQIGYVSILLLVMSLFIFMSIPRLLSLEAHWSSDETRWLDRSEHFMSAVKEGEFSKTLIAYHPGVTTMWIAGLRTYFVTAGVNFLNLIWARLFISIFVWVGIGIAWFLIYKLLGQWIALAAFVNLAYSPLILAHTRRVHTDAIATTFILLTVLLFLCYCQNSQQRRYLVLSGIAFGLALLSKSYALILLFWLPICLFIFRDRRKTGKVFFTNIAELLCFLNCTAITILSFWPIFWTPFFVLLTFCLCILTLLILKGYLKNEQQSIVVLLSGITLILVGVSVILITKDVLEKVNWAITTPHEVEQLFLGKISNDPGWLFYPFVFTIYSTPLMIPFAFIACILLWKQRKNSSQSTQHFRLTMSLLAGLILFTICLTTTSKKLSRYLLPVFPMIEILAAIGFVRGLKWIYAALYSRVGTDTKLKDVLAVLACIAFFFFQVVPILKLHPYYGTYYNLCWKVTDITKIISFGSASGLDIAAKYINQKPNAQHMLVQVSPLATEFVGYYFQGFVYRSDLETNIMPDYEVVYIRDSQIKRVPETGTLNGKLEHVVTLNGIDLVWIYRVEQ